MEHADRVRLAEIGAGVAAVGILYTLRAAVWVLGRLLDGVKIELPPENRFHPDSPYNIASQITLRDPLDED